jgi:putative ABC transport system permease protein
MLHLIALRNVRVHWKQSFAAFMSIAAAFLCFVVFQGYMLDTHNLYLDGYRNRSMYGDIIIQDKAAVSSEGQRDFWRHELSLQDQEALQKIMQKHHSEIYETVRFLTFQGMISTGNSSKIFVASAYDVNAGARMREQWKWNVLYGLPMHETKIANPILLGKSLAAQLACDPDKVEYTLLPQGGYLPKERPFHCRRSDMQLSVTTHSGQLNAMDFEVAGLIDAGYKDVDSRYLTLPLPLAQTLLNTKTISFLTVKLNPGVELKPWIAEINKEIEAVNPNIIAMDWTEHPVGDLYRKTMSLLNIFRNFVTIVVALISILSVMNTMVKIIKERTREIGTLLSIGFQRHQVMRIFLYEAAFTGFSSCVAGAVISILVSLALNALHIPYKAGLLSEPVLFRIEIDPGLYLFATALLVVVTTLASYISCRSTLNKKIVDCLGHV